MEHTEEITELPQFDQLNLKPAVLDGLNAMGFEKPTPIQAMGIPPILDNKDLIGCAQTGTGKTGAFVIPLLSKFQGGDSKHIRSLILVPTRELALQIDQQIDGFGYFSEVSSAPVYGGNQPGEFELQKKAIQRGCDILIATPGRLISHLNLGYLDLSKVETLVLDEADRMLDMGFIGDIMKIIELLPAKRQNLMFSATMAPGIRKLAKEILHEPEQINLAIAKPAEGVTQSVYLVHDKYKIPLLQDIIQNQEVQNMIIFAAKKTSVDEIERALKRLKFDVRSIHSGRSQEERNHTMQDFKGSRFPILVATDIVSRGIDIAGLSHVLNYDLPDDPADYVHRVGRTARAERDGEAISFVNERDQHYLDRIEKLIERELDKKNTPEEIGPSPEYNPGKSRSGGGRSSRHRGGGGGGGNNRRKQSGGGGGNRNKHRGKGGNSNNQAKAKGQGEGNSDQQKPQGQGGNNNNNRRKKRRGPRPPRPGNSSGNSES